MRRLLAATLLAMTTLTAGCGGDEADEPPNEDATQPQGDEAGNAQQEPDEWWTSYETFQTYFQENYPNFPDDVGSKQIEWEGQYKSYDNPFHVVSLPEFTIMLEGNEVPVEIRVSGEGRRDVWNEFEPGETVRFTANWEGGMGSTSRSGTIVGVDVTLINGLPVQK